MNFLSAKTKIILEREIKARLSKKSFWVLTLLVPIIFLFYILFSVWVTKSNEEHYDIAYTVASDSGLRLDSTKDLTFTLIPEMSFDTLRKSSELYDAYLKVNWNESQLYSKENMSAPAISEIEDQLDKWKLQRNYSQFDISPQIVDSLNQASHMKIIERIGKDEKESMSELAMILGMFIALIMYMLITINGTNVMRAVSEEKTNRVIEVLVSSARPYEIMTGKVVGVCIVGLIQIAVWILGIILISSIAGGVMNNHAMPGTSTMGGGMGTTPMPSDLDMLFGLNWIKIIISFISFFILGYFMYSCFFAAVGNLVSADPTEAQSFTLPIMLPIILSISLVQPVSSNPSGALSLFLSYFPLTSPIIMMSRVAFDIPYWQIGLSLVILLIALIMSLRVTSSIYRAGVFYTGQKLKLKDIPKLLRWNKGN